MVLSTPNPQFFMTVHVYDAPTEYATIEQLPDNQLVGNVTITISGPRTFGPDTTPTGIFVISTEIPSGSYSITAAKTGYTTRTVPVTVDNNCVIRQVLVSGSVVCHFLLRLQQA